MHENYKKDIVENIFKTNVTSMFKGDYVSSRAVYSDDSFVYKVFKQSKIVDQFEMFLKKSFIEFLIIILLKILPKVAATVKTPFGR